MPRVISGSARGTRLSVPPGNLLRPTGDKVKGALFSIIAPKMPANGFLDLYAGIGQIGLEAASRGAGPVVLVENAPASLAAIRANSIKTHLEEKVEILAGDVSSLLPRLAEKGRRFEVIFLDPPYASAIQAFGKHSGWLGRLLAPDGIVVLEHDSSEPPPAFVTNLQLYRSCQYGTAMLSFYKVDQSVKPETPQAQL
jgi:16S rRNA (guanine966-N2)-methyltransferase